ncbi:MAG TPA: CpsB/CapC family capsule biosynthesis tyrosine phosphatase [Gemmataceae bacterium]|nr:CpsB/CapC family capsule biosynthesis tyrosine phosphatase [Gemmataceae bacterium]
MLDLHCHILPGVDDGPVSSDEALAVARLCVADGITHVIATPHCHRHIHLLRADILPHVERFRADLAAVQIPLTVLPGSEIQVTDSAEYRREFEAGLYCHLGDRPDFTLLEFSWDPALYPPDAGGLVAWACDRGTVPIIAHPERYKVFQEDPERLGALAGAGAWFQVTVDSLLGDHGSKPRSFGEEIIRAYPEVVLATDAHRPGRCSGLSLGYAWVRDRVGPAREADLRARAEAVLARILAPA